MYGAGGVWEKPEPNYHRPLVSLGNKVPTGALSVGWCVVKLLCSGGGQSSPALCPSGVERVGCLLFSCCCFSLGQ